MDLVDAKRIEQTDVMHNVIVERIHRRIVTRFAKSGMVGVEDAELVRPGLREFVTVERARPVQEEQRLALACGVEDRVDAVDVQRLFLEVDHWLPPRIIPLLDARAACRARAASHPPRSTAGSSSLSN